MAAHAQTEGDLWLAVARGPAALARHCPALITHFGTLAGVFDAGEAAWRELGLTKPVRDWLAAPDWQAIAADQRWLAQSGASLLTLDDPRYPLLLREIPDPPPVLFVLGDPRHLARAQLAVVGSRNPTPAGQETAYAFATHLAARGLAITSGLALGIDAAAHTGALDADGGCTIAVTGTGLDRVYPAAHRDLARRIARHGALVSEFPPGTPPLPSHFPRRNRLISGLSLGTLVVEAALRSGSLISARLALEQGREVFAIPGSIHNPLARGCHRLLRDGAKLVETGDDILEELVPQLGVIDRDAPSENVSREPGRDLDPAHQQVFSAVGFEPTPVDLVVARTGLTADAVCSILFELELHGWVRSAAGGQYLRAG